MARTVNIHIHRTTDWNESDHPRADNGEFGKGSATYQKHAAEASAASHAAKSADDHHEAALKHFGAGYAAHHDKDVQRLHNSEGDRHRRSSQILQRDPSMEKKVGAYNKEASEAADLSLSAQTPDEHEDAARAQWGAGVFASHIKGHEESEADHEATGDSNKKHAKGLRNATGK